MKKKFKKSTPKQVKEMRDLHNEGWPSTKIAKKLRKDVSTVFYWIKKDFNYVPMVVIPKEEKKEEKEEEKEIIIDKNACINCSKKKKESKWSKTHFCSMFCWDEFLIKRLNSREYRLQNWNL